MEVRPQARKSVAGEVVGLLTFLSGVALLVGTFVIAWQLFQRPPEEALGLQPKQALDVNAVARTGLGLAYQIVLLVLMSFLASLVANRGIKLYSVARADLLPSAPKKPSPEEREMIAIASTRD